MVAPLRRTEGQTLMFNCERNGSDRLLKELVEQGINIIVPPRDGVTAGDLILGDEDGAIRKADWKVVMGAAPPLRPRISRASRR